MMINYYLLYHNNKFVIVSDELRNMDDWFISGAPFSEYKHIIGKKIIATDESFYLDGLPQFLFDDLKKMKFSFETINNLRKELLLDSEKINEMFYKKLFEKPYKIKLIMDEDKVKIYNDPKFENGFIMINEFIYE